MNFLWFSARKDGSVTMRYRGNPDEWDEALKENFLCAVRDLVLDMTGEDIFGVVEIIDLPELSDSIH